MNESEFQKKYSDLPKKIQDFLISEKLTEITKNIVILAKLDIDQTTQLTEMIGNVLMSEISLMDFSQNAESHLKISPAQSRIIIRLVQKEIFDQFKEELKKHKPLSRIPEEKTPKELQEEFLPDASLKKHHEEISKEQTTSQFGELKKIIIPKNYSYLQKQELPKEIDTQMPAEKIPLKEKMAQPKPKTETKKEENKKESIETTEQIISEQEFSAKDIPEYSFPEASEVKIEKPISKIGEFKKVIAPKTSSSKQEKIRNKLLEAMTKKDIQPQIVSEMKNILLKKQRGEERTEKEEEPLRKKTISETSPSQIFYGKGTDFQEEKPSAKISDKKPYILDVKLKETKQKKKEKEVSLEPVQYQKYKKESPFGKA